MPYKCHFISTRNASKSLSRLWQWLIIKTPSAFYFVYRWLYVYSTQLPFNKVCSQQHGPVLQEFVEWCDNSSLELNVSKSKEMVVTFSNKQRQKVLAAKAYWYCWEVQVPWYNVLTICWNWGDIEEMPAATIPFEEAQRLSLCSTILT